MSSRFGFRVSITEATDEEAEPSAVSFELSGGLIPRLDRLAGFFPEVVAGVGTSMRDCCAESAAGYPAAAAAAEAAAEPEVEGAGAGAEAMAARTTPAWRLESTLLLHLSAAIRWDGFLFPLRGPTPQEDRLAGTAVPPPAAHEPGRI